MENMSNLSVNVTADLAYINARCKS